MPKTACKFVLFAATFLISASAAFAQSAPVIGPPVNAGSYLQAGLPNSGIAQGSMFIIFGSGMTSGSGVFYASSFPLPTTLNGTTVSVTVSGTTVAAIMSYVSPGQLAAILPSGTPLGTGTVTVSFGGKISNAASITVVSNTFGALATNSSGDGPAVIFNNSQQQPGQAPPVNSLFVSAAPGQVAELWGTGLGGITGSDAAPPQQSNQYGAQTTVVVGGVVSPQVQYAGRSTFAGIDQINFVIPSGVSGCYVPVYVVINNIPSNVTTMAIAANGGGPCSDAIQLSSSDISTLQNGKNNVGVIAAEHFTLNANLAAFGGAVSGNVDQVEAQFSQTQSSQAFNPGPFLQGVPSLGYCTAAQYTYNPSRGVTNAIGGNANYPYQANSIGAGSSLTISGAAGSQPIAEDSPGSGEYKAQLGGINPSNGAVSPTYFNPGAFTIGNVSGETIGAFSATLTIPATITWTNAPNPSATIQRAQPLFVNWTGASSSEFVEITGSSVNTTTNAGAAFICTAAGTAGIAGTFTVPAAIVSMLPASGLSGSDRVGFLTVGKSLLRSGNSFTAPNMQLGYLTYEEEQIVNVNFQ